MGNYIPTQPSSKQIAANAIRDMFFDRQYNGVVPTKDLEVVKHGKQWHRMYGKKAIQDAVIELISEKYINLDGLGDNWMWGGDMHEMLFGKEL